jgi:hypothetical protein
MSLKKLQQSKPQQRGTAARNAVPSSNGMGRALSSDAAFDRIVYETSLLTKETPANDIIMGDLELAFKRILRRK